MNPWPFVLSAYCVAICLTAGLLGWSYLAMRRAEAASDSLKNQ